MNTKKFLLFILLIFLVILLFFLNIFILNQDKGIENEFLEKFNLKKNENISFVENFSEEKNKDNKIIDDYANKDNDIKPINMLFFGDLMLDRHVGEKINKYGLDYLLEKLNTENFNSKYDLISANLEGATTDNGSHYLPNNAYDFAFHPKTINELKKYNFNFFNLANNHLSDQGAKGINETYKNLSDLGFYYSGCRDALLSSSEDFIKISENNSMPILSEDNCSNIILEIKNKKIALLGISMVYNEIDKDKIISRIIKLQENSDIVIVNVHFGLEYQGKANVKQETLAKEMIDAGADIIIGHHPHVIQNYEIYKEKPIFYSLGNFIFDQYFSAETQEGLVIKIVLQLDEKNKNKIEFEVYKIKTKGSKIEEILKMP